MRTAGQGQHLSYHCTAECLKSNWNLHRDYHKQAPSNGGLENGGTVDGSRGGKHDGSISDSWQEVGKKGTYTPTLEDVGYTLKYECCIIDRLHPYAPASGRTEVVQTSRVRPTPSPPTRSLVQLVPTAQPTPSPGAANLGRFTVLTYNLLADLYAKGDSNQSCPAWSLAWQYRKKNLLREILAYKADILCLQEVQSDAYTDFWSPELQRAGYVAIYKKKTAEVFTDNKYTIDGCATFFRKDRFQLVKKYEVEFNKAAVSLTEAITNPAHKKTALNRLLKDNVALIAVLEAVEPAVLDANAKRTLICVANTHIHANPELNDVKLWQVHTLLKGLEKIAASADIPMLVAGDFNSVPGSMAHCLLVKGRIDPALMLETYNDPLGLVKESKMSHTLPLSSAYAAMADAPLSNDTRLAKQRTRLDPRHHEPLITNVTKDFKGTLDYILYTNTSLRPTAVLELPLLDGEVLSKTEDQLPNAQFSSDHLALLAEFQYVPHSSARNS
ncbi:MAG: hypothetical protein WDW36_008014 [Sanguina aurantia]